MPKLTLERPDIEKIRHHGETEALQNACRSYLGVAKDHVHRADASGFSEFESRLEDARLALKCAEELYRAFGPSQGKTDDA